MLHGAGRRQPARRRLQQTVDELRTRPLLLITSSLIHPNQIHFANLMRERRHLVLSLLALNLFNVQLRSHAATGFRTI